MKKLKAAVIGVGHLGQYHAQKYAQLAHVELIGVCDHDAARAQEIANTNQTQAYGNYHALIGEADVVSIAVPTIGHFSVATDCLNAGCHLLIEKPITATPEEAKQLIALAKSKDLILQVGHLERFNPVLIAAQEHGVSAAQFIEATRISPFNPRGCDVDVIIDLMIHDIDLIQSIVQSPIEKIDAISATVVTEHADIANARLNFENGCVANVTASRISAKTERKMRVFENHAYMSLDFHTRKFEVRTVSEDSSPEALHVESESLSFPQHDALLDEIVHFVDCVQAGNTPKVTGEDGLLALEIAMSIRQALQTHLSTHLKDRKA